MSETSKQHCPQVLPQAIHRFSVSPRTPLGKGHGLRRRSFLLGSFNPAKPSTRTSAIGYGLTQLNCPLKRINPIWSSSIPSALTRRSVDRHRRASITRFSGRLRRMMSTGFNMQSTGSQSPPGPPSRRLPSVASGERHYDGYFSLWAGSTLTTPVFGPNNGVHRRKPSLCTPPPGLSPNSNGEVRPVCYTP